MTKTNYDTTEQPPPGHDATLDGFRRALHVPKSEIDKREKEWREKRKPKDSMPKGR